jgi:hypothetical protein
VRAFAQQGARVAFCGTRPDGGRPLADELAAAGLPAPWYAACDVRDVAAYQAVLARAAADLGPVRVLVNNAGRDDRHRMEDVTPEFWDDRLALNLKHYFFAIQAVAPRHGKGRRRQRGEHGLGELDARAPQPGRLHHGQGRHPGADAHPGARAGRARASASMRWCPAPSSPSARPRCTATRRPTRLVVIGGGATGLGVALDAAARGFSVALVEADDFAKGTSSRATKLVHGGVRYLAQGNVALVREALRERATLLAQCAASRAAAPFVMPVYARPLGSLFYGAGLKLYDALAGKARPGRHRAALSRRRARAVCPDCAATASPAASSTGTDSSTTRASPSRSHARRRARRGWC